MRALPLTLTIALLTSTAVSVSAQTSSTAEPRKSSVAFETDILAYGINGYSAMINYSFANGLQIAGGIGSYDVPKFLLEGEEHYGSAKWKARAQSLSVIRATYRFNGPMKSGPALGVVVLNQNWKVTSETMTGEAKFSPFSVGLTAGYYWHVTKSLYIYPTTAFTSNSVIAGEAKLNNTPYTVARFAPNASLHMGWAWSR
jgi:hypothetical protein